MVKSNQQGKRDWGNLPEEESSAVRLGRWEGAICVKMPLLGLGVRVGVAVGIPERGKGFEGNRKEGQGDGRITGDGAGKMGRSKITEEALFQSFGITRNDNP